MPKVRQTSKTLHRQRFKQLRVKTGESVETDAAVAAPIRAAQYVRMSTDHQKYSTLNQSAANHAYAEAHNMEIVRTYADDGKSGLSIRRRDGLKKLLSDIQEDAANFSVVLVYDVSRWGRFQDADESGYYEFHCKKAGIQVIYCGEQFINDGSPLATIIKGIKRAMAGEYSRELSVKVFAGQSRLAQMGFTLGARAGYGLRRMLVDQNGVVKRILSPREWKSITTDHVTFVPGPSNEIATVHWIFKSFVHDQKTELQIANALNEQGILNAQGHVWTRHGILQVLTHANISAITFGINAPESWTQKWLVIDRRSGSGRKTRLKRLLNAHYSTQLKSSSSHISYVPLMGAAEDILTKNSCKHSKTFCSNMAISLVRFWKQALVPVPIRTKDDLVALLLRSNVLASRRNTVFVVARSRQLAGLADYPQKKCWAVCAVCGKTADA
jgi:DNA invertase Pin-like site-specific DNA recombinase